MTADLQSLRQRINAAAERIREHVRQTYLEHSPLLSDLCAGSVYCKLENLQHTGSFKLRGAFNKILSLSETDRKNGIVTSSSGNHGAGVAYALKTLKQSGTIYVPENVVPEKARNIERLGGQLTYFGTDVVETDAEAYRFAEQHGMTFISPYNDLDVVAGQGTIGVELLHQMTSLDAVFVAVGGGGLISGIGACLKTALPGIEVVGCSPQNSAVMMASVEAGHVLDMPSLPTLSDGTAGGVEPGAVTFELCSTIVDRWVSVTESEISGAIRLFLAEHRMAVEGAAGVALAAFQKTSTDYAGKFVAIIICGGNIGRDKLQSVLSESLTPGPAKPAPGR
jgi:threonine dehydratase